MCQCKAEIAHRSAQWVLMYWRIRHINDRYWLHSSLASSIEFSVYCWPCVLTLYKSDVWTETSKVVNSLNAVVICEVKLFQNYFRGLLQLANIFQYVQCRFQSSFSGWNDFISVSDVVTCEIEHWNNFKIILFHMFNHGFKWEESFVNLWVLIIFPPRCVG